MGLNRVHLLALFPLSDVFFTFLSLGFFSPELKFSFRVIYQQVFLLDGYSFTRSPFDFVVLLSIRLLLLIAAALVIALKKDTFIKEVDPVEQSEKDTEKAVVRSYFEKFKLPILGLSIFSLSYGIVKLLAFSENVKLLYYPGVWLILTWSWICPPLFCALWYISLSGHNYTRLSSSDEENPKPEELVYDEEKKKEEKEDRMSKWNHIKRLVLFCLIEWKAFLPGFIFLFLYSGVRICLPLYTGRAVSIVTKTGGSGSLFGSVAIVAALIIASMVLSGLRGGFLTYAAYLVSTRVRRDLYASLIKQEIAFFDVTKTGDIMSRLTSDCAVISESMSLNVNVFTRNGIMILGTFTMTFILSWRLTLLNFVAIPLIIYLTKVYGDIFEKMTEEQQQAIADANQKGQEALSTMRTVRSFGREKKEGERFSQMLDETLAIGKKISIAITGNYVVSDLNSLSLVAVLAYGGHLVAAGRMSPADFLAFMFYQQQLGDNLLELGEVWTGLMKSVGASRKVFDCINRKPAIAYDGSRTEEVKGEIRFEGIHFNYPSRPNDHILKGLNLHVKAGETVALVGPSGEGKSSIVALLEHLYEPNKGNITLDRVPIKDYNHIYFHQRVVLVSQEPPLYAVSIRENIAYGRDGATMEEIIEVAKKANAHDFVMKLKKGYDTLCGEKGVMMSGGQKQRIAIARALLMKPAVLILDEATSALDAESENVVQEALNKDSRGRTVLIIAHRLSTIKNADKIAVIHQGEIVEMGTHSELMKNKKGVYYNLVVKQLKGEETEEDQTAVVDDKEVKVQKGDEVKEEDNDGQTPVKF